MKGLVHIGESKLARPPSGASRHIICFGYLRSIQALFGVTPVLLDCEEFVDKYYGKVPHDEAKETAEKWIKEASSVVENQTDEIIESAKFYVCSTGTGEQLGDSATLLGLRAIEEDSE